MSVRVTHPNPSILIVNLRLTGDVLLSTPLALSIKQQIPGATVDYLVYRGTEGVLAKNPHVRRVHTVGSGMTGLRAFLRLWRQYDFSIGTNASDRTTIYTFGAGRHSIGFTLPYRSYWWKPLLVSESRIYDTLKHAVPAMLDQLQALDVKPVPRVVMNFDAKDKAFVEQKLGTKDYVLLHPFSRQIYKYWPAAAWAKLASMIRSETGLLAVFSRGVGAGDEQQLAQIRAAAGEPFECFPETFTLNQLAAAIRQARAYVGVDTVGTHLAAALDGPVVALFGPTPADRWGPWPNDCTAPAPYSRTGGTQRRGRITLLQPAWPCVPCDKQSCAITQRGKMECLEQLTPETVFQELKTLLMT